MTDRKMVDEEAAQRDGEEELDFESGEAWELDAAPKPTRERRAKTSEPAPLTDVAVLAVMIGIWNVIVVPAGAQPVDLGSLPDNQRASALRAWRSTFRTAEAWQAHCRRIAKSRSCMGHRARGISPATRRPVSFSWALMPQNIAAVRDGCHDDKAPATEDDDDMDPFDDEEARP